MRARLFVKREATIWHRLSNLMLRKLIIKTSLSQNWLMSINCCLKKAPRFISVTDSKKNYYVIFFPVRFSRPKNNYSRKTNIIFIFCIDFFKTFFLLTFEISLLDLFIIFCYDFCTRFTKTKVKFVVSPLTSIHNNYVQQWNCDLKCWFTYFSYYFKHSWTKTSQIKFCRKNFSA